MAVGAVFDQRDGLQVRTVGDGLQAGLGELGGDPLDGDFGASFERQASFEGVGGQERQVGAEVGGFDGIETGGESRRGLGQESEGEEEKGIVSRSTKCSSENAARQRAAAADSPPHTEARVWAKQNTLKRSVFHFELQAVCPETGARAGILHTAHGDVETPVFMPVGTQATVKGLLPRDLINDLDAKIILGNTYHLYLRPGHETIRQAGRTAQVHELAAGDPYRFGRVSGVQPERAAEDHAKRACCSIRI